MVKVLAKQNGQAEQSNAITEKVKTPATSTQRTETSSTPTIFS
ncbi:hypothetical protein [Frischella sp. Ac48]|nr:hypothetical protein [Frischella sp. Ac48]